MTLHPGAGLHREPRPPEPTPPAGARLFASPLPRVETDERYTPPWVFDGLASSNRHPGLLVVPYGR